MLYYVAHGSIERYEDSMGILWGYIPNIWKYGRYCGLNQPWWARKWVLVKSLGYRSGPTNGWSCLGFSIHPYGGNTVSSAHTRRVISSSPIVCRDDVRCEESSVPAGNNIFGLLADDAKKFKRSFLDRPRPPNYHMNIHKFALYPIPLVHFSNLLQAVWGSEIMGHLCIQIFGIVSAILGKVRKYVWGLVSLVVSCFPVYIMLRFLDEFQFAMAESL